MSVSLFSFNAVLVGTQTRHITSEVEFLLHGRNARSKKNLNIHPDVHVRGGVEEPLHNVRLVGEGGGVEEGLFTSGGGDREGTRQTRQT